MGIGPDVAVWELNDRVPFFVRLPHPLEIDHAAGPLALAAGQTDFAPTLLALLGIDPARLPYVGRNLLGRPDDPPILRPYGDWLDRAHLFSSRRASDRDRSCYVLASAEYGDESACRDANEGARQTRDISRLVVTDDLQQRLRDALR